MPSDDHYEYPAKLSYIVDGDTQDYEVDLGFNLTKKIRVRLVEIDTHEIYGVEKESREYMKGQKDMEYVRGWLETARRTWDEDDWPLILDTKKDDTGKFGRYLADVIRRHDGDSLVDALLERENR